MTKIKPKKVTIANPAAASSPPPVANLSTFNLCKLIKLLNRKKLLALKWFQRIGMLNRETACDNCGRPMTLVHRQNCTGSRADKYEWECNKCRMCTKSLRNGTVFQSSKLSLQKITILMYFWAHDFPPCVAQRELSITVRTVNKWYLLCQEACMDALIRNTSKLGGEGRNLEVVEGKLGKRAVDNYRTPAEHPVIGVIDVDNGSCFLQVVIGNTKATLITLLKERIANGTTLHSKCWRLRECYSDDKFCKVVKNHKLTLSNEVGNTFQKLHAKACKSGDNVGTELSFDPLLCAAIYKNAMKNEEFFFVKFLGELGTLYRDGIRYEMMSQLEHTDSEAGTSSQQREAVNVSEKMEWTSTVGSPCFRCRSKQYTNSEVQATASDEITVCEETDEAQNVSVSQQNVRRSGCLPEGNSSTTDDIIMLEDTCKSVSSIMVEKSADGPGYICHLGGSVCDFVMEPVELETVADHSGLERSATTSGLVSEGVCAEENVLLTLEDHNQMPNSSVREKSKQVSKQSSKVVNCTANNVVLLEGDGNLQNDVPVEEDGCMSGSHDVIDIGGDELNEIRTDADMEDDREPEANTNVEHINEIDISMEEQKDVCDKVNEGQTVETSVDEGEVTTCEEEEDVRGHVGVTGDGDSEKAVHGLHDEDSDTDTYEQKDANTGTNVTAKRQSRIVFKIRAKKKVVPLKMILPAGWSTDVDSDVNGDGVGDDEDIANADEKREADSDLVNIDDADENSNECAGKGSKANATAAKRRETDSDLTNIDDVEDNSDECTVEGSKTNASPDRKRDATSGPVKNVNPEIKASERTVKGRKTNVTPTRKREAASDLVNIDSVEDNADGHTVKRSKTNETASRKKDATPDLVNIDDAGDKTNESTVKLSKTIAGKKRDSASDLIDTEDTEGNANESTVKRSKTAAGNKRDSTSNLVDIDDAEVDANESTVKCSKKTVDKKRDSASDLVDIDDVQDNSNESTVKSSKTDAGKKRDSASDLVDIDDAESNVNESSVNHSKTTAGKKRDSASNLVDIDDAEGNTNECTVKCSKTTANADKKEEGGSAVVIIDGNENERTEVLSKRNPTGKRNNDVASTVVNIDDVDDSSDEQKDVISKRNATSKRNSDMESNVVNIDDVDDSSDEQKDVLSRRNATGKRNSDAESDVVNIEDVDDNAGKCEGSPKNANPVARKESAIFTDVIDVDEGDSDVELIETEAQSGPDVMVVCEQKRKVFPKEESQRHERRLLVDDVPCSLPKSVLRTYFGKFGRVEQIKILPMPSRRSQRYAVMEFNTKQAVDAIQAARPHVVESGVEFVTYRGSSRDVDTSLNTRLKDRIIVKVQKDNGKLTTDDIQQYFATYGHVYHIERVMLTGVESGSSTYVVSFEDYDCADVACLNSPHTIKGVENITCEKMEDDELLLSGTEMDPICIEYDSDVEEVPVDDPKTEPSFTRQSEELKSLDEPSTSGLQSSGGKRLSGEGADVSRKKFCGYNTFERNVRTPQNTTMANPIPSVSHLPGTRTPTVTNGRIGLYTPQGGSNSGGQGSGTNSWHTQGAPGRPFYRNPAATAGSPPR
ncbi:serine-aspartate repeat-containing protein I-like [Schistocerca americana]|uniref:serine-aspartate repeat-containing protein I-like n=1 Tax=Schistocerca americana TaxID=7009 RepID=UPI001F50189D|nr:serine-aspartate repeat-containing protein I-like [Schistocerca americana]